MNLISNRQAGWRKSALAVMLFAAFGSAALAGSGQVQGEAPASGQAVPGTPSAKDPWIAKWLSVTADRTPMAVKAGVDYGLDPNTGTFIFPKATPESHDGQKFPGQLDHWDRTMLTKNVEVIAFYEGVGSPFHAWNNVLDYEGKRYLYIHDRDYLRIMDVTDPAHAKVVYSKGAVWSEKGPSEDYDPRTVKNYWGGMTIAWNKKLNKPVLVASYEIGRYGLMEDKLKEPQRVAEQRNYNSLKGFKVYAMNGPLPKDWELLATRTTDVAHPDAPVGKQQGSGSLDSPEYFGGKYMILASAPDDSYALTEYSNYLYSPGYQVWDMSNPADPKFVKQITVPGQKADDPASVFEYLKNPRAGNRTSWMGARMPIFLPKPLEKGGKFGFGAMGGLGLWSFDLSDPANPRILDNVNTPPSFSGTEFDNADVSQYERTGYVLTSGYPLNTDCNEPYKDIWVVNAKDPAHMKVEARLPRPVPPEGAPYTSFCQRGGSFGPKRSNSIGQPGAWRQNIVPYSFYNAGVQLFDVTDPAKPRIAGYFVPPMADETELPAYLGGSQGVFAMYTEYDRNLMWAFTDNGAYVLSSPLLGEPVMGAPAKPWPAR